MAARLDRIVRRIAVVSSRRRCAPRSSGTSPRSPSPAAPAARLASASSRAPPRASPVQAAPRTGSGTAPCTNRSAAVSARARAPAERSRTSLRTTPGSGARTGAGTTASAFGSVLRTSACGSGRTARRSRAAAAPLRGLRPRRFPPRSCSAPCRSRPPGGGFGSHTPRSRLRVCAFGALGVPSRTLPVPAGAALLLDRACNTPLFSPLRFLTPQDRACPGPLHVRLPIPSPRNPPVIRALHAEPSASPLTSASALRHNPRPYAGFDRSLARRRAIVASSRSRRSPQSGSKYPRGSEPFPIENATAFPGRTPPVAQKKARTRVRKRPDRPRNCRDRRTTLKALPERTGASASPIPNGRRSREAAQTRGITPAEFVRERVLDLVRNPSATAPVAIPADLVPLIERTFRYTYMLATRMRDDLTGAGQNEQLETLIAEARRLQDELRARGAD